VSKFGVCTGCGLVVNKGPYFTRRIMRHLNDRDRRLSETGHNHDAMELFDEYGPVEMWEPKADAGNGGK